jgi:hypothetical protein
VDNTIEILNLNYNDFTDKGKWLLFKSLEVCNNKNTNLKVILRNIPLSPNFMRDAFKNVNKITLTLERISLFNGNKRPATRANDHEEITEVVDKIQEFKKTPETVE